MTIEKLKETWQHSYEEALNKIEDYLQPQSNDYFEKTQFRTLANWFMNTKHSSHEYMLGAFKGFTCDPFEFVNVLSIVNHALLDDGDISFVTMKLEEKTIGIFIAFIWQHEDNFRAICERENKDIIDMRISSRERMHNFIVDKKINAMAQQIPDKPLITKEDFVFEAHDDPLRFIEEFEAFQKLQQDIRIESDRKIKEMTKQLKF